MTIISAVRQAMREAGGMSRFLENADEIEAELAERFGVGPATIARAEEAIAGRLAELQSMAKPALEAFERFRHALVSGDDELAHELLQQIADDLQACGYQAMRRNANGR